MNSAEIKHEIITICFEFFKDSGFNLDMFEYADFIDDLGMDSITFITMIVGIEERFSITIPDDKLLMENFQSIDNIVQIISKLMV